MNWDIHTKLLLKECPQDFVSYFAPGARYVGMRETHFQTRVDSAFKRREMRGDLAIEAEENGEHFLITPEFQSKMDKKMDERLLGYSYEATRLSNLNVLSAVFYLLPVEGTPQPPLKRAIPNGYRALWFNYRHIELSKMQVEEIRHINLDGFWPWMVLCEDGANRATADMVFDYLESKQRGNLILLAKFYADMVFTAKDDKYWLQRRFEMSQEFLWENTSVYRDILKQGKKQGREEGKKQGRAEGKKEGREEGREEGIEQGRVSGRIQEAQQNIEIIVQERFPDLLTLAKSRVEQLTDLAQLQTLFLKVFRAQTAEEIEQLLPAVPVPVSVPAQGHE